MTLSRSAVGDGVASPCCHSKDIGMTPIVAHPAVPEPMRYVVELFLATTLNRFMRLLHIFWRRRPILPRKSARIRDHEWRLTVLGHRSVRMPLTYVAL